ncbi:hypothetical protein GCM10027059_30440 [Myceligenerans halotolerans]
MSDETGFSSDQATTAPPRDAAASGIPNHFFGSLTTDFYAGIGRMSALSALLEDRLRALVQAMKRVPQTKYTRTTIGGLVTMAEERARTLGDDWEAFGEFTMRLRDVLQLRNDLVHNLWQPKPGGTFFGHRDGQEPATISLSDVETGVSELVALYGEWRHWYDLAGALPIQSERS